MASASLRLLLASVAAISLASCESERRAKEISRRLGNEIDSRVEATRSAEAEGPTLRRADDPHLGVVGATAPPPARLPDRVESEGGFTLNTAIRLEPAAIAQRIQDATGIPVILDLAFGPTDAVEKRARPVRYRGPLSRFLDTACARWDASWEFSEGVIRISDMLTELYRVRASTAESDLDFQTSGNQGGTGSITTGIRVETAFWREIERALADLVSPGRFHLSPASGIVSITAPPSVHRRAAAFLEEANSVYDARIAIEVVAAFVDVTDADEFGLSLDFLRQVLGEDIVLGLGSTGASTAPVVAALRVRGDSAWSGSSGLVRALSRSDRVVDYRTASAITRHGSPVPINLARRRDIVRSIEVTVTEDKRTTSVESETIDTGLAMSAYPRLLEGKRIHLTLSLVASDLVELLPYDAGGDSGTIQLATIEERRLTHDLVIEQGETLLLAGYEQEKAGIRKKGVGAPELFALGGGSTADTRLHRLFLLVSARVL